MKLASHVINDTRSIGCQEDTPDIVMDLIKLRNELATDKKGSVWASKKLDALIQKYGV